MSICLPCSTLLHGHNILKSSDFLAPSVLCAGQNARLTEKYKRVVKRSEETNENVRKVLTSVSGCDPEKSLRLGWSRSIFLWHSATTAGQRTIIWVSRHSLVSRHLDCIEWISIQCGRKTSSSCSERRRHRLKRAEIMSYKKRELLEKEDQIETPTTRSKKEAQCPPAQWHWRWHWSGRFTP